MPEQFNDPSSTPRSNGRLNGASPADAADLLLNSGSEAEAEPNAELVAQVVTQAQEVGFVALGRFASTR